MDVNRSNITLVVLLKCDGCGAAQRFKHHVCRVANGSMVSVQHNDPGSFLRSVLVFHTKKRPSVLDVRVLDLWLPLLWMHGFWIPVVSSPLAVWVLDAAVSSALGRLGFTFK